MNIVFLRGRVRRPAERRVLDSGAVVVNYEVAARRDDTAADIVPIVWHDPADVDTALGYGTGDEVVVVGHVRRRFFRVGGATQSRTEVVVETLVPARQAKKASALLARRVEEVLSG